MIPEPHRVAFQGFSAFERSALSSYFRLAERQPAYLQVADMAEAQFIIADADHPGVIDAVLAADRAADTVFIGAQAPEGSMAWMMRPIDPMHVLRELDAIIKLRRNGASLPPAVAPIARRAAPPSTFERPTRRASDSEPGALGSPEPQPAAAPPALHVLMVDDSELALRFLERHLQGLGFETQRATTSAQALELLAQQPFAFVFLDVELGDDSELDGLMLCQHIKHYRRYAGDRAPVVVMLSAHVQAVDRVRGTLAGCDAYLGKPLDEADLRRTLIQHGATLPRPKAAH